jgi:hypothetical protein
MKMNERQTEKLLKILAMVDGATTDGETAAAMNRATALLDGTGMTLAEFRDQFGGDADENPERVEIMVNESRLMIKSKRNETWHWSVVRAVCNVCGLELVYRDNCGTHIDGVRYSEYIVVGTNDALIAGARLLDHIVNSAYPKSIKAYRQTMEYQMLPNGTAKRIHSKDFRLGFYATLWHRASEAKEQREQDERKRLNNEWRGDTALIRATDIIRRRTRELIETKADEVRSGVKLKRTHSSARAQSGGYKAGANAGKAVNINKPSGQRQLS